MSFRRRQIPDEGGDSPINISPLIDVIFILLIFFVVAGIFGDSAAEKIDLPASQTANSSDTLLAKISVSADGGVLLDGRRTALDSLEFELSRRPDLKGVCIYSDASVPVGRLLGVMDAAKRGGVGEIFIASKK